MRNDITEVMIGVRSNGTIDIDFEVPDDDDGWVFSNLSIEHATFLHQELGLAIERAKLRAESVKHK